MIALLAPGQGSQTPGMLAEWLNLPGAGDRIDRWSQISGLDLARLGTTATAEVSPSSARSGSSSRAGTGRGAPPQPATAFIPEIASPALR